MGDSDDCGCGGTGTGFGACVKINPDGVCLAVDVIDSNGKGREAYFCVRSVS
jgi:hypothetical protein